MIRTEHYEVKGIPFVRTYSDANRYVVRDGVAYTEACDPASLNRVYTEGDEIRDEEGSELDIESAARILLDEGLVKLPEEEEPDYLNENEPEPDYFA